MTGKKVCKGVEPHHSCLSKTIERFLKKADVCRKRGIGEARRLLHVDSLLQCAVEECSFNVQVANDVPIVGSKSKENSNGVKSGYW